MEILALLDEFRAMAQTGLSYADNPYDEARYERMLELVSAYYGKALDRPPADIRERLAGRVGQVTPNVAAEAVIFDDEGRILLMERPGGGRWCLPGGALEVSESPEAGAVRETREETGLEVEPRELVGAYRRGPTAEFPHATVQLPYRCTVTGGSLQLSHEGEDLQYWPIEDVPEWLTNHERMARDARELANDGGDRPS